MRPSEELEGFRAQQLDLAAGMCDENRRDPCLLLDPGKLGAERLAQLLVERRKWLVKEKELRPACQRAGKRSPLLLPRRRARGGTVAPHA